MNVCLELRRNFVGEHANFDAYACFAQASDATARNFGVGVCDADDYSRDAGANYCLRTRAGATGVIARFKCRIERGTASKFAGAGESINFGVRAAWATC